jgi:hypothetical protein
MTELGIQTIQVSGDFVLTQVHFKSSFVTQWKYISLNHFDSWNRLERNV